jgi:ABC-2 type transport system permease protein
MAMIFNLVMPIVFLLFFGSMFGGTSSETKVAIGLVDRDGGVVAEQIEAALAKAFTVTRGEETDLVRALGSDKVHVVLFLPEEFTHKVSRSGGSGTVRILFNQGSMASGQAAAGAAAIIDAFDAQLSGAARRVQVSVEKAEAAAGLNPFDYMVPGNLVYMLLNAGVITVAMGLANRRSGGTFRHMFSTPLPLGVWLTARLASTLVFALVQITLLFTAAWVVFDVKPPVDLFGTSVVVGLSALAAMSIGLAIGVLVRSNEAVNALALIVGMGLTFLSGAMLPIDHAPQFIQSFSKLLPSTYMLQALRFVMMQGRGLGEVLPHLAVLAATIVVCLGLGFWRMGKQLQEV